MAIKLDPEQAREQREWMAELYRRGGFTTKAEWARAARYPATNLSEVMNGTAGIQGINLIRLYKAAESRARAMERPAAAETTDAEIAEFALRLLRLARELTARLGLEAADE